MTCLALDSCYSNVLRMVKIGKIGKVVDTKSDFYIVTSKKIRSDLGIHGGFKALFNEQVEVGFMAGSDYAYSESLIFLGDLTNKGNNYYTINISGLYKLMLGESTDNIYLRGSIQNLLRSGNNSSYFNLGICYLNIL